MTLMPPGTGTRIAQSMGAYATAVAMNTAVTILLFVAGFAIAGVPWWLLTGFVCGVLNAIPLIGSPLALCLALLVQFLAKGALMPVLYAAAVWLVVQVVEGFVLSPRAAGRAGVHPLLSIPIVLVAGLAFGPAGMILAVPVTAVILIVTRARRSP